MILVSFIFFPDDADPYEVEVETFTADKVAGLIQEVRAQHWHACQWSAYESWGPAYSYARAWAPAWAEDPAPPRVEWTTPSGDDELVELPC